jgi:hypothetical protein
MKRTDFFQLVQPLTEQLYSAAYALLPDDLQAEQLVMDAVNAFLFKEKKTILKRQLDLRSKREVQLARRQTLRRILRYMAEIGFRRAAQLGENPRGAELAEFKNFYSLDPKVRFTIKLRFETQLSVEEIEEVLSMARFEVIEKIHNGRYMLLSNIEQGAEA